MDSTMQAVLQFVEENDVKFIRLAFCDVMGTLKISPSCPASFRARSKRGFLSTHRPFWASRP